MLILVGVTINLATNGGLFEKSRTAKTGTQREVDREQLLAALMTGFEEGGNFDITGVTLPADMEWCEEEDLEYPGNEVIPIKEQGCWVITKSNNKFYVDEHGNILDKKESVNYITFSEEGVLPAFTINMNFLAEKDYSKFRNDGSSYRKLMLRKGGDWIGCKPSEDDSNSISIIAVEVGKDKTYIYVIEPCTIDEQKITETGWYEFKEKYVKLSEAPVFDEGYKLDEDLKENVKILNEYYGKIFIKVTK